MHGVRSEREKMLEAMLFASGESVSVDKLASAIGCDIPLTRNLLSRMADTYKEEDGGILLSEAEDSFRLTTNPKYYGAVERLLRIKPRRPLSQAMLETMAIIAFKQPVTKVVIESIRGVNCDHSVNKLLEYGLVTELGRLEAPGRPIIFGTTEDFLLFYGLGSVEELRHLSAVGIGNSRVQQGE